MEAAAGPWDGVAQLDSFGAQTLLDLLAPDLAAVAAAVFPLLSAHGLSPAEATVDDVLAVEGLADQVVDAAAVAVSRVDQVGLYPAGTTPGGWGRGLPPTRGEVPALVANQAPVSRDVSTLPAGWQLHVDVGPRYLKFDEDGEPCYPDAPPFEEFWPKCPPPDEPADVPDVPCLEDSRFVRAEARLRELRNFGRVPTSFRGFDYREELERSVFRPVDELYRCGAEQSDPSLLASWHGPPDDATIRVYKPFLDLGLGLGFDLVSMITGPVDFRAAILLHEHVHRIEDPRMGTVCARGPRLPPGGVTRAGRLPALRHRVRRRLHPGACTSARASPWRGWSATSTPGRAGRERGVASDAAVTTTEPNQKPQGGTETEGAAAREALSAPKPRPRSRGGRRPPPDHLPADTEKHEVCACARRGGRVFKRDVLTSSVYTHVRPAAAHPTRARDLRGPRVQRGDDRTMPMPSERALYDCRFLAWLIVMKFVLLVPLRKVALLRNNSLYAGGEAGVVRLCTLFTLIGTCRQIGVDAYCYLEWALERVVPHPANRGLVPDDLTPAAYKAFLAA